MISVVIPMYNSSETILKALGSIKNQTYTATDIEIIIVNDGSTDRSLQVVEEYIQTNFIKNILLITVENGGAAKARNIGLKNAAGNWIAFLDADDEWASNKLDVQMEILNNRLDIDFLGCTRNSECVKSVFWKKFEKLTKIGPKLLMVRFVFVVPTIIFKREILQGVGLFEEKQRYAEEGNYFIRIASKYNCYLLNQSLVTTGGGKAHYGESGLSKNIWKMEKGELKNLNDAKQLKILNFPEYVFLVTFSLMKYWRRFLIVKLKLRK